MGLWRIEVRPKPGQFDPVGRQTLGGLADSGIRSVRRVQSGRLFVLELAGKSAAENDVVRRIGQALLADPVVEEIRVSGEADAPPEPDDGLAIEVHYKPGVMDNVAQSTMLALADMGIEAKSVRTARRFELFPIPGDAELARIPRLLGNTCIEEVVIGTKRLAPPPKPPVYEFKLRTVDILNLDDAALATRSTTGHLFLSVEEMRAIQAHFRLLGREPTDLELETLAQTWSEHCVHKTLKSAIAYRGAPMPHPRVMKSNSRTVEIDRATVKLRYENLLRDTIARATEELMREGRGPKCLSVFKDNAGVIAFDDEFGIAFKVETHNHPSAIEPYGGAATGVGGVIRDVLGCGLGAKPIANTDVFCVAPPDWPIDAVPRGVIHPKSVLKGIVSGVRDYGNRMGIPTVNGAVQFDPRYLGNPLVYCGCVGIIPRDRIEKQARPGDAIVLMGGRTGRDGIHGATFSSTELTDTHEDEFAHAVQIGNAIEEKKALDVILQARDFVGADVRRGCLFSAITDCGAGGLSSAVGEMAAETGADVDLGKAPLKYAGLRYDEIWISEAQERMVLAVPPPNVDALLSMAASEGVEATVIGRFTDTGRLVVRYDGQQVGDLDLKFLHDGLPCVTREARWDTSEATSSAHSACASAGRAKSDGESDWVGELESRLSNPTTASKHWIIRQYDHEVGGRSVVKPLVGRYDGPADAAVIRPRLDSNRGIAIGCGLALQRDGLDPYWMAIAAIDEAIRNVVCVGGDPSRTAILDNFCWPRADDPRNMGALVRACQACYDAAKAYGVPFISGKDSLNNEFSMGATDAEMVRRAIENRWSGLGAGVDASGRLAIPHTLLISAVSLVEDVSRCITSSVKRVEQASLYYVGTDSSDWRSTNLAILAEMHAAVGRAVAAGDILALHDCSEGGPAVAVAEMAIAADIGVRYHVARVGLLADPFAEVASGYIVQVRREGVLKAIDEIDGLVLRRIATLRPNGVDPEFEFVAAESDHRLSGTPIESLRRAWQEPLGW